MIDRGQTVLPTEAQKRVIARELDRRVEIDSRVVIDRTPALPDATEEIELGEGVTLYPRVRLLDGALFLRPSLDDDADNHAAFGIRS